MHLIYLKSNHLNKLFFTENLNNLVDKCDNEKKKTEQIKTLNPMRRYMYEFCKSNFIFEDIFNAKSYLFWQAFILLEFLSIC